MTFWDNEKENALSDSNKCSMSGVCFVVKACVKRRIQKLHLVPCPLFEFCPTSSFANQVRQQMTVLVGFWRGIESVGSFCKYNFFFLPRHAKAIHVCFMLNATCSSTFGL